MEDKGNGDGTELDDLLESAETGTAEEPSESPVVAFVTRLLLEAVKPGVAALHFDPLPEAGRFQIRIREADRTLRPLETPPRPPLAAVMSRLKIMAALDIAERRLPQDGRIRVKVQGRDFALMFATLPTAAGERGTLVAERSRAQPRTLEQSDAPASVVAAVRAALQEGGLLLAASTDRRRSEEFLGVLALEADTAARVAIAIGCDPGRLPPGCVPATVDPKVGATLSAGIRAARRQDPDLLIVPDVPDSETASGLLEAADAGIAVLACVPVDGAGSALRRLLDLGTDPLKLSGAFRLAICRHASRRQGREAFSYELLKNEPALQRALAARADPAALAQAMAGCGLKDCREQPG